MNQIFKPSYKKVLFTVIVFLFLPVFRYNIPTMCECKPGEHCNCKNILYLPPLATIFLGINYLQFSWVTIVGFFIAYVISCLLLRLLSYFQLLKFTEFFKPTKFKIIIASVGWISVLSIFFHFLSGLYGGTSNFPPFLTNIYGIVDFVSIILFPFTIITHYVLFYFDFTVILILFEYIKIPTSGIGGLHPSYMSPLAASIVIPMIILEWYAISCIVVNFFSQRRKL